MTSVHLLAWFHGLSVCGMLCTSTGYAHVPAASQVPFTLRTQLFSFNPDQLVQHHHRWSYLLLLLKPSFARAQQQLLLCHSSAASQHMLISAAIS